jgi:hypothetical protein
MPARHATGPWSSIPWLAGAGYARLDRPVVQSFTKHPVRLLNTQGADAISRLLSTFTVRSSVFCLSELRAPWGFEVSGGTRPDPRIDAAVTLIRDQAARQWTVQTLASTSAALTKAFKREFEMSPGRYRETRGSADAMLISVAENESTRRAMDILDDEETLA